MNANTVSKILDVLFPVTVAITIVIMLLCIFAELWLPLVR